MTPIQEVYLETEFGDDEAARQARDARVEYLQAQGWICTCKTLYTVWGYCVFYLEALLPETSNAMAEFELDSGLSSQSPSEGRSSVRPRKRDPGSNTYEVR
jgi:hypothetical protein